ncbi:Zinc finger, CCHC-type [Penicillium camemberti]|uniref:Zinc finger, CCHC-type n=1 Tax=Penicillium camemberti (strain FM 013) TaxID=1429867 RepID=A0A0G4PPJ2_PENC3|nr:Zinc finger, CCHC-type [Penicillium camemberti]
MADPPTGGPEPPPTNTQETQASFSVKDFQPRVSIDTGQIIGKRTRNGEAYTPAEGTGRITTREVWKLIDNLKDIIHHQTTLIESTKADLEEVKHDQNILQEQNDRLHEEAAIAASGTSDPQSSLQRPEKDRNYVRISTQRSSVDPRDNENREGNSFGRYLSTASANTYIRSALLSAPPTQDAQVAGIGTTKTGYLVRFKDPGSADIARNNTEWLNELGNNTKLIKPRFGIVVHRTPTENFDLENTNSQAIQTIIEENDLAEQDFQIEDIWFDSTEGAEYILNNSLLVRQRYIGSIERREIKKKRCFRCQRFGHLAWSCKETPRCGHCTGQHERQRYPPGIRARCLDCSGKHPTVETDATRFRSLIYINRRVPTASHRQTPDSQILLFSVYLPSVPLYSGDNTSAEPTLTAIQNIITSTLQDNRQTTSIILSGDFNRHHPL